MNANSYLHRFGGVPNIAGCPPVGTVAKIFETALQTAHNSLVNSLLPPHGKDAETDEDGYSPLHNARAAARPLLFRTGIAEVPVGICGTTFLVGRKGRVFLITAAHLIRDAHSEIVLVFPCDGSQTPLTLSNGFSVGLGDGHSDEYDVIVYEITFNDIPKADRLKSRIYWLDQEWALNWQPDCYNSLFFLMGYPKEMNEVDYDNRVLNTNQVLLSGGYVWSADGQTTLHAVDIDNPLPIRHFGGLSGSPVLSLTSRLASSSIIRFCGIAVWGTAEAERIHFLEARVIVDLIDQAAEHLRFTC